MKELLTAVKDVNDAVCSEQDTGSDACFEGNRKVILQSTLKLLGLAVASIFHDRLKVTSLYLEADGKSEDLAELDILLQETSTSLSTVVKLMEVPNAKSGGHDAVETTSSSGEKSPVRSHAATGVAYNELPASASETSPSEDLGHPSRTMPLAVDTLATGLEGQPCRDSSVVSPRRSRRTRSVRTEVKAFLQSKRGRNDSAIPLETTVIKDEKSAPSRSCEDMDVVKDRSVGNIPSGASSEVDSKPATPGGGSTRRCRTKRKVSPPGVLRKDDNALAPDICESSTGDVEDFVTRMKDKSFVCKLCDKMRASSMFNIKRHLFSVHHLNATPRDALYACSACDFRHVFKCEVDNHEKVTHHRSADRRRRKRDVAVERFPEPSGGDNPRGKKAVTNGDGIRAAVPADNHGSPETGCGGGENRRSRRPGKRLQKLPIDMEAPSEDIEIPLSDAEVSSRRADSHSEGSVARSKRRKVDTVQADLVVTDDTVLDVFRCATCRSFIKACSKADHKKKCPGKPNLIQSVPSLTELRCLLCGDRDGRDVEYESRKELYRHMEEKHTAVAGEKGTRRQFACPHCDTGYTYARKGNSGAAFPVENAFGSLLQHLVSCHHLAVPAWIKSEVCSHAGCGWVGVMSKTLATHALSHSAKVPCGVCGKMLASSSLRHHLKTCARTVVPNSRETAAASPNDNSRAEDDDEAVANDNLCPECGMTFSGDNDLEEHIIQAHSGRRQEAVQEDKYPKKYMCHICPHSFPFKHRLEGHLFRLHGIKGAGNKVFKCTLCGYTHINKFGVKLHVRDVHLKKHEGGGTGWLKPRRRRPDSNLIATPQTSLAAVPLDNDAADAQQLLVTSGAIPDNVQEVIVDSDNSWACLGAVEDAEGAAADAGEENVLLLSAGVVLSQPCEAFGVTISADDLKREPSEQSVTHLDETLVQDLVDFEVEAPDAETSGPEVIQTPSDHAGDTNSLLEADSFVVEVAGTPGCDVDGASPRRHQCEECGVILDVGTPLEEHRAACLGQKRKEDGPVMDFTVTYLEYRCFLCIDNNATVYSGPKTLWIHTKEVHFKSPSTEGGDSDSGPQYACPFCTKVFSCTTSRGLSAGIVHRKVSQILQHWVSSHATPVPDFIKAVRCEMPGCAYVAVLSNSIRAHMSVHREKVACPRCLKALVAESLKVHLQNCGVDVEERRQCRCGYCGRLYISQKCLTRHIALVHEKRRDHACDICSTAYFRMNDVMLHKFRAHGVNANNRTPYQCAYCDVIDLSQAYIKAHMWRVHYRKGQLSEPIQRIRRVKAGSRKPKSKSTAKKPSSSVKHVVTNVELEPVDTQ